MSHDWIQRKVVKQLDKSGSFVLYKIKLPRFTGYQFDCDGCHKTWIPNSVAIKDGRWHKIYCPSCFAGYKSSSASVKGWGAIATCIIDSKVHYVTVCDQPDREEMEADLIRHCTLDLGASDAVVRVVGYYEFMAVAENPDTGEFGWGGAIYRGDAESMAGVLCGNSTNSWVFSCHSRILNEHAHLIGACPG